MAATRFIAMRFREISNHASTTYAKITLNRQVRLMASLAEKRNNLQALDILSIRQPINQNDEDLTKAYRISIKDMKTIFTHGFPSRLSNRVTDFKEFHMIIRKHSLEIIKAIRSLREGNTPPRFVLFGDDGTGKSVALSHVIHFCASAEWLILHIPAAHSITNSKEATEPSTWKENRIDQPHEAAHWLKSFKIVNQSFLEKLTTSQDYQWGRQEKIPAGSTIGKIVETGMSRSNFATDAVGIILKEVRAKEKLKVLYAVDGFNHFFTTSSIFNTNSQLADPQDLSLVRHFTRILEPGKSLTCGCYAMALSRTGNFKTYTRSTEVKEQIGQRGIVALGEHNPVLVENFSKTELHNYLLLLQQTDMLHKVVNEQLEQEISFLTDKNPSDINRLIKGF